MPHPTHDRSHLLKSTSVDLRCATDITGVDLRCATDITGVDHLTFDTGCTIIAGDHDHDHGDIGLGGAGTTTA